MITLAQAVKIAKDFFGDDMILSNDCLDVGFGYVFGARRKDGIVLSGGLDLIVNKENGEYRTAHYIPLPGNEFAELVDSGKKINISKFI